MESERDLVHAEEYALEIEIKPPTTTTTQTAALERNDTDDSCTVLIHQKQRDASPEARPDASSSSSSSTSSSKNGNPPSPPDGGYGWLIVLGSFLLHIIIGGFERSEGVFFLQFQDEFHESAQLTAWPGALAAGIVSLMSPIATAISSRYSIRTCCMMGSALQFIGFAMSSWTPNFYFLFISHALLVGIGRGLLYAPCIVIVNMYFDKRRSLGVGLAASGVGVGSFLIVPATQFLFDLYGFSGAFLVISALTFHGFLVAMLFRPLSLHHKFTQAGRLKDTEMSFLTKENEERTEDIVTSDRSDGVKKRLTKSAPLERESPVTHMDRNTECVPSSFQICFPKEESDFVTKKTKNKIFHFNLLKDPSFLLFCISISLFTSAFKAAAVFVPALVKSKGHTETEATFVLSIAGVADTISRILTGFLFDVACIKRFRTMYYNIFLFALAVISFILPSLTGYTAFCFVMSLYGSFSGAYISQRSVVIVDILGIENMAFGFGMLVFFQGAGAAIGPPLAGAFKDAFGTYNEAFYVGGALMFLAGVVMVCCNGVLKVRQRKEKKSSI